MRAYLPALSTDLLADTLPERRGFTAVAPSGAGREDLEVLEDDAQTEAALASLIALREAEGEAPRRIVLAVDVDAPSPSGTGVLETAALGAQWSVVRAILVDAPDAEGAVRAVVRAEGQDEADAAVAALWEHSLEWFDVTERDALALALRARR